MFAPPEMERCMGGGEVEKERRQSVTNSWL